MSTMAKHGIPSKMKAALIGLLAAILTFLYTGVYAQFIPDRYFEQIDAASLTAYNVALQTVTDNVQASAPANWRQTFKNKSVKDQIRLVIKNTGSQVAKYDYRVSMRVDWWDVNGVPGNFNINMDLSYDPAKNKMYNDHSVFEFKNAHRFYVTILQVTEKSTNTSVSIANLKRNFDIQEEIIVERYYLNDYDAPIAQTRLTSAFTWNSLLNTYTISLSWPAYVGQAEGPVTYELEWQWVDDYTSQKGVYQLMSSLSYDFRNNSTRVLTRQPFYTFDLVAEHGYLLYRVRKLKVDSVDYKYVKVSRWSPDLPDAGPVATYPKMQGLFPHMNDNMNWQYTATFAEGSRQSTSVNYFDGGFKNRQQVAKSNADNLVMVGESKYDHQGRPAISVLPVPAFKPDDTYDNHLHYFSNFNQNINGLSFSAYDFDSLDTINLCRADTVTRMSPNSGAAKYYSSLNPDKSKQQKHVADASGYPFVHTEFTPDNTNRPKRQGGAGYTHQLGRGRETKYNYAKPFQVQLDRLFGGETGNASHYKYHSVKDPNGQMSVSYLDMSGKVIATALTGPSTGNTDPLSSHPSSPQLVFTSLAQNNLRGTTAIELNQKIPVEVAGDHYFDYRVNTSFFRDNCLPSSICLECNYIYTLAISDECGVTLFSITDTIGKVNPYDTSCTGGTYFKMFNKGAMLNGIYSQVEAAIISGDSLLRLKNLPIGNYTLHKKLFINPAAIEYFKTVYLRHADSLCVHNYNYFYQQEYSQLDFSGCNSCDTCLENDYCGTILEIMKSDVSPGGQYALYPANGGFSVFSSNGGGAWPYTQGVYRDGEGVLDSLTSNNGTKIPPGSATVDEFINNFNIAWADELVKFHPEYCYYLFCRDSLNSSYSFDMAFNSEESFKAAKRKGFLNPTGRTDLKYDYPVGMDSLFYRRPTWKSAMDHRLMKYKEVEGTYYSVWDMAGMVAYCGNKSDSKEMYACLKALSNRQVIDSLFYDSIQMRTFWNTFRGMYYSVKSRILDSIFTAYVSSGNSTGCRGCFALNNCTGIYANKARRFPINLYDYNRPDTTQMREAIDDANKKFQEDSSCYAMSFYWVEQLKACTSDTSLLRQIREGFEYVCVNSSGTLYNSSGLGAIEIPEDQRAGKTFVSFDQVLETYLGTNYRTALCNVDLLKGVYKPGHNYFEDANRKCQCTYNSKIYAPSIPVRLSPDIVPPPGASWKCVRDSSYLTPYGILQGQYLQELLQTGDLLKPDIDIKVKKYNTYGGINAHLGDLRVHNPDIFDDPDFGVYELWLNLEDSAKTSLCNTVLKLTPALTQILQGSAVGSSSFINIRPDTNPYGLDDGSDFLIDLVYTNANGTVDTVTINGTTGCKKVWVKACVLWDTLPAPPQGPPGEPDTAATQTEEDPLPAFYALSDSIRLGLKDALVVGKAGAYKCPDNYEFNSEGSGWGCITKIHPKHIALVKSVNEILWRLRPQQYNLEKDTGRCETIPTFARRNRVMLKSPTYRKVFGLKWNRYNGIWFFGVDTTDENHDCYSDVNVFNDPEFIGGVNFGVHQCDPDKINCKLTFGDPYDVGINLSDIDSLYNVHFDPTMLDVVAIGRSRSDTSKKYIISVRSCYTNPYCDSLRRVSTSPLASRTNNEVTIRGKKYGFSCANDWLTIRKDCDRYHRDQAFVTTIKNASSYFFMERLLGDMAIDTVWNNDLGIYENKLFSTSSQPYSFASLGSAVPSRISDLMDTMSYHIDELKDSLLIGYIGNPLSIGRGCQLSLRAIQGNVDFRRIRKFTGMQPDTTKLAEYMAQGDFEKGRHYFTIYARYADGDTTVALRGWLSCAPVYECFKAYYPKEETESGSSCACLTCSEVKWAVDSFKTIYPEVAFNHDNYPDMLTHYLNNHLNNNRSFEEYVNFMNNCNMFNKMAFTQTAYDYQVTANWGVSCLDAIDSIVKWYSEKTALNIQYLKYRNPFSAVPRATISFDLSNLGRDERLKFIQLMEDTLADLPCSSMLSDKDVAAPCDYTIDLETHPSGSNNVSSTQISNYINNVVIPLYPGVSLGAIQNLKLHHRYKKNNSSDTVVNISRFCLSFGSMSTEDRYAVMDSLKKMLDTCYVVRQMCRLIKKADLVFDGIENKTLCIPKVDSSYKIPVAPECLTCNNLYDKMIAYQDSTYKYNRGLIRESLLPGNVEAYLHNRFRLEVDAYEKENLCENCPPASLQICVLSQQGLEMLDFLRAFQEQSWLITEGSVELPANPDAYYSTTLNTTGASLVYYEGVNLVDSLQITINPENPCVITLFRGSDPNFQYIDTLINFEYIDSMTIVSMRTVQDAPGKFLLTIRDRYLKKEYTIAGRSSCYNFSACCTLPKPSLCFRPMAEEIEIDTNDCRDRLIALAKGNAEYRYNKYIDSVNYALQWSYTKFCLDNAESTEKIRYAFLDGQHHMTLYYYDRAGNLVKTIPPNGVKKINVNNDTSLMLQNWRNTSAPSSYVHSRHNMATYYRYNSLNQVMFQHSPDGDSSIFYYDITGRLVLSQDARQRQMGRNLGVPGKRFYSYSLFDAQGRMIEVGQIYADTVRRDSIELGTKVYLNSWINAGVRTEVTRTFYDAPMSAAISAEFGSNGQEHLRTRVASTAYYDSWTGNVMAYNSATHFSYDIHGNVQVLIQDFPELQALSQRFKKIYYQYDLISGNVNMISYQPGQPDRFYHRYTYDADNRLQIVETSADSMIWDRDASYNYYKHGTLARTELGTHKVQGLDYAYTIQGWIKGVNSNTLNTKRDMGQDGGTLAPLDVARDVMGYTLGYFNDDYMPINRNLYLSDSSFQAIETAAQLLNNPGRQLYNGNISHMVTALSPFMQNGKGPLANTYDYDQLNRLTRAQTYSNISLDSNRWRAGTTPMPDYLNTFAYDANGNILKQYRAGSSTAPYLAMDSLTYFYESNTNKLNYVRDQIGANNYSATSGGVVDIDNQSANNYRYDKIGNLVKDQAEKIDTILWNLYGKIKEVKFNSTAAKADLQFRYNPGGQRVQKMLKNGTTENNWNSTYYVRDAQGNVMATYQLKSSVESNQNNFTAVTNWIVSNYGVTQLSDLIAQRFSTDPVFLSLYSQKLTDLGLENAIYSHYTAADFINWDQSTVTVIISNFDNGNQARRDDFIEKFVDFDHKGLVYALMDCDAENFISSILSDSKTDVQFLQYFCDHGFQQQLEDVCAALGIGPGPGHPCEDYRDALLAYGNKQQIAQELIAHIGMDDLKKAIETYVDINDLKDMLKNNTYAFGGILNALNSCYSIDQLTNFLLDVYVDMSYLTSVLYAHHPVQALLDLVAQNDPYNFILYAVGADYNVLNEILAQLSNFDVNAYMNLVKNRWGEAAYQSLAASMIYTQQFKLAEHYVYGSGRLGVRLSDTTLFRRDISLNGFDASGRYIINQVLNKDSLRIDTARAWRYLTRKQYELSNHLGNVLASISDRRTPIGSTSISYYEADVQQATDYYAFGAPLPGRQWYVNSDVKYRFGYNGMERDNELKGDANSLDFGARIYDPRVGRFLTMDRMQSLQADQSPYHFAGNQPIWAIDKNGDIKVIVITHVKQPGGQDYITQHEVEVPTAEEEKGIRRSTMIVHAYAIRVPYRVNANLNGYRNIVYSYKVEEGTGETFGEEMKRKDPLPYYLSKFMMSTPMGPIMEAMEGKELYSGERLTAAGRATKGVEGFLDMLSLGSASMSKYVTSKIKDMVITEALSVVMTKGFGLDGDQYASFIYQTTKFYYSASKGEIDSFKKFMEEYAGKTNATAAFIDKLLKDYNIDVNKPKDKKEAAKEAVENGADGEVLPNAVDLTVD